MEPAAPVPQALSGAPARDRPVVHRWVVAGMLAVWPWLVAPGLIQPDTKLDLTITPWRYLGRALEAWSTHTGIGELQNQAYGYLFPMGPVMGMAHSAGMPAWGAQRLWWGLVLVVGYLGAERLARRLNVATGWSAVLVGVAYTLAPRVMSVLAEISIEAWPGALAPWLVLVALPMVAPGAATDTRVRGALRTGALVACLGGVNATASLVVLALPLLWLLTAARARRRGWAVLAWAGGAALGSLWWMLPLLILGRYGYPFLDFIESAATTTKVTTVSNVLRGTQHWVAWILTVDDHPTWQGGWVLAQYVPAIVATCILAGLGVAGLLRLEHPHVRRWALTAAVLAIVTMAMGHAGTAGAPLATQVQHLLDGPLAPLRNVHKADPLLRLPLSLGLGALAAATRGRWPRLAPGLRITTGATAVAIGIGATLPVWIGRVGDAWAYRALPDEWRTVAAQVDRDAATRGGTTLLLPGARFAAYAFGRTNDEPLSALARSPVLVRAAAPLGHPGATRLLDAIDISVTRGRPDPALAATLARLGVARVVVRHGLTPAAEAGPADAVEATLGASPGLTRTAQVGDISLWRVDSFDPVPVTAYPLSDTVRVQGGPEALPGLLAAGIVDETRAVVLASGDDPAGSPLVVTDTLRRATFNAGRRIEVARGETRAPGDPGPPPGRRDLPPAGPDAAQPTRSYHGLTAVVASSEASDPFASAWRGAGSAAFAAVDGDPATSWLADPRDDTPTLEVTLPSPTTLGRVTVRVASGAGTVPPAAVEVRADGRVIPVSRAGPEFRADLTGTTVRRLRIVLEGAQATSRALVGITEVEAEGLDGRSAIAIPRVAAQELADVVLQSDPRGSQGEDAATWLRRLDLAEDVNGPLSATVVARSGETLDAALDAPWRVTGGSGGSGGTGTGRAASHRPGAAVDGDPSTAWTPATTALQHRLVVDFGTVHTITAVRLAGATAGTSSVLVSGADASAIIRGSGGPVPAMTTRRVTLTFTPAGPGRWQAPEVTFAGAPRVLEDTIALPCGSAGTVRIDGRAHPLALTASREDILTGAPLPAANCTGGIALTAGRHDVVVEAGDAALVDSVVVAAPRAPAHSRRGIRVVSWSGPERSLDVRAGPAAVLALTEGANPGWRARDGHGRELAPVVVDGWRQGFVIPAGADIRVTIAFAPAPWYRGGLIAGGIVALLLIGAALAGARRAQLPPVTSEDWREAVPMPRARILVGTTVAATAGLLVAGPVGLLAGLCAGATRARHGPGAAVVALAASGMAMSMLGMAAQHPAGALAGQALGSYVLGLLVAGLVTGAASRHPDGPTPARDARGATS